MGRVYSCLIRVFQWWPEFLIFSYSLPGWAEFNHVCLESNPKVGKSPTNVVYCRVYHGLVEFTHVGLQSTRGGQCSPNI
jgi:hypothetical protein